MKLFLPRTLRRQLGTTTGSEAPKGGLELRTAQESRDLAYRLKLIARDRGVAAAAPSGGTLHGLALLEEVWQRLLGRYVQSRDSRLLHRVLEVLTIQMGDERLQEMLDRFAADFLTITSEAPLDSETAVAPSRSSDDRQEVLMELLVFWLIHSNPAVGPQISLLHDSDFVHDPLFEGFGEGVAEFLSNLPGLDEEEDSLLDMLLAPYRAAPDSLLQQLRLLLGRWGSLLSGLGEQLQLGIDVIAEEEAPRFVSGAGPVQAPTLPLQDSGRASFSQDRDWMPELVLVAKNIYVWLDQISKAHGRPIHRLDEIPDQALENLARWGFTGLWLIGVWERSPASERIKRQAGNPEAMASAYSLRRYQVAENLGGDTALDVLEHRAGRHGIRLASDMVPNHTGIDSDWLLTHPDWFLSEATSPFPSYSFEGPDLSPSSGVGIFLEDHYWDRSDAAVVFKRLDRASGEARYIYHGNDGTSMPWNDTAQLDYLNSELREVVIDTIVGVARQFPVIRFDAAMTLAKKHYQRLWFPEPGDSGAIPSRAERGLSKAEFDRHMPHEFWREVVDRVSVEAPDTLLMAEAFWLMEGYFVRSLGMHRVYNSAFMNMLRDRRNAEYRALIKETLEYDPRILGRYVNFMSNPDEATALEQFGREDFYFGVCTLMATLPGLPMFGHGQVEGLSEKYGMEYAKAYRDEPADEGMMARHQREIAPLLHRRDLFAGVERFLFFDGLDNQGRVNEDVFAYSNGTEGERVVVLFNNSEAGTRVRVHESALFRDIASGESPGATRSATLSQGLGIASDRHLMVRFHDRISGEEFVVRSEDLDSRGLGVDLGPYQCRVFERFSELWDRDGRWAPLASRLAGRGVEDLSAALRELQLEPLRMAFEEALPTAVMECLLALPEAGSGSESAECEQRVLAGMSGLLDWVARRWSQSSGHESEQADGDDWLRAAFSLLEDLDPPERDEGEAGEGEAPESHERRALRESPELLVGLTAWILIQTATDVLHRSLADPELIEGWQPAWAVEEQLMSLGLPFVKVRGLSQTLSFASRRGWQTAEPPETALGLLRSWLADDEIRGILDVHRYENEEYLRKEALEILLSWHFLRAVLQEKVGLAPDDGEGEARIEAWSKLVDGVAEMAAASEYRVSDLQDRLERSRDI
jgi:glycosidase